MATLSVKATTGRVSLIVVAAVLTWACVAPPLAERLIVERPLARADAILVLAGASALVERTEEAAVMYRKGLAPKVVLTDDGIRAGWSSKEQTNPPFVELARRQLVAHSVPSAAIEILTRQVSGTIVEARLMSETAAERRWDALLIVTSPYHTRRALRTFDAVFAKVGLTTRIGIVAPPPGQQSPPASYWWLTATGWQYVAGEYVKSLYYYCVDYF